MAFSMHSHSGEFCPGHAKDTLEEIILAAIGHGMKTFALTEHMPRDSNEDLYPEEILAGDDITPLLPRHELFLTKALTLRTKYAPQITILIGFEGEYIRPSYSTFIITLLSSPNVDFFIGSLHHTHTIPIDYDKNMYLKAQAKSGGTDEGVFCDYFDEQFHMLESLKPRVVGHFDLIRLYSSHQNDDMSTLGSGKTWEKIKRNLKSVVDTGGLLEVNSSGLRKGMKEPYPGAAIAKEFKRMGGKLTLSDDSHGVNQVGVCYRGVFEFLEVCGVSEVWTFEGREGNRSGDRELKLKRVGLEEVKESFKD